MNTTVETYIGSMPMLPFYVIGGFLLAITIIWLVCARRNKEQLTEQKEKLRKQKVHDKEVFTEDSLDEELEPNNWYAWVVGICICLYVWIVGAVITHVWAKYFFINCADVDNNKALFGDSFGAVNALISAFAFAGMIVAFIMQRYELKLQRKELRMTRDEMSEQTREFDTQNKIMRQEQFENTLFQMLHTHHENIMSMQAGDVRGRDCFEVFVSQLRDLYFGVNKILDGIDKNKQIDLGPHQKRAVEILSKMSKEERNDFAFYMAYGYLFYGTQYKSSYKKDSDAAFLSLMVSQVVNGAEVAIITSSTMVNKPRSSQLGHYYRHLYQMVKFVNRQRKLYFFQRYEYMKMIRAQLSDYEQVLLYYNAISPLGRLWLEADQVHEDKNAFAYSLLVGYRLIKNIPHFFTYFYYDPRVRLKKELALWESTHEDNFFEQLKQYPDSNEE